MIPTEPGDVPLATGRQAPERRHLPRPGFRMRLLGSMVGLLVVAIVLGVLLQRAVLLRRLASDVDAALQRERDALEQLAGGTDPATGQPFGDDAAAIFDVFLRHHVPDEDAVYVAFVDGVPYRTTPGPLRLDRDPQLAARWSRLTIGERGRIDTTAGPVEYIAVPLVADGVTHGVFVVAHFTQAERDEIARWLRVEAAISGLVLLFVVLVGWFVAGRMLRPVRQLTETARTISDTDLTRRIPVEGHDELARLARTFNDMLERLEAGFVAQRAFVDDAGHELRTPITIVRGHLELMGDGMEERAETLALVDDELDRMSRIVEDLLVLAKVEQPDFIRCEPVELADLTTELFVKSGSLGRRDWRLDECAEGVIVVDAQRITQAVLNLARNAVEHTAPGAEIGIGSTLDGTAVRIWVRDTGTGVALEDRERIFDRFARGSDRRRSDGAGLGLAIVRSVAGAHRGRVELDSPPSSGATFTLVLPNGGT